MGRKILIGCGAISILGVLLVIFIVVVSAVSGGGGEQAGNNQAPADQKKPSGGAKQGAKTVKVGEALQVGDASWTITDARQVNEISSKFLPPKQGNFVTVDFAFTNNSNKAATLTTNSLALLDAKGRKFEANTDSFGYIDPPDKNIFFQQVNPGVTQEGQVIFTVAPGASDFKLELGDTKAFSNTKGYVKLDF